LFSIPGRRPIEYPGAFYLIIRPHAFIDQRQKVFLFALMLENEARRIQPLISLIYADERNKTS
jgi:hypothetical protein